jgi:tRNA threonylcarbamoyladenosine biosynthesis protein TsaB
MLVLAIDTSGRHGGITLARGDRDRVEIIESTSIQGGTFSAELIPQISEILSKNRISLQQLEGLVAVTGPGSFTGLRVGLSAVKGLAEVLKIPIAAVSALEALASAVQPPSPVMAMLDAGRSEVYVGIYDRQSGEAVEELMALGDAIQLAERRKLRVVVAEQALAEKFPGAYTVDRPGSEAAAALGLRKLSARDTVDVLALDANYVRKTEAEYLQRLKR